MRCTVRAVHSSIGALGILEQRGLFISLVSTRQRRIIFSVAGAGGFGTGRGGGKTDGNNVLSETGRVDAHIINTGQARVSAPTGPATAAISGMGSDATVGRNRRLAGGAIIIEADSASFRAVRRGSIGNAGSPSDNNFREDICDSTVLVRYLGVDRPVDATLLRSMDVIMGMVMIMVVVSVAVAVTVPSKDEEANKVGEQTGGTDDQNKLRVGNFRRFDKTSQGFEDDGNAKGDEEDCIEECAQNFGSYPLVEC